jgi:hypothetical protein
VAAAAHIAVVAPRLVEAVLALSGYVIQTHLPLLQRRDHQQSHALAATVFINSPAQAH